jgi:anti-sigma factor RsiW
VAGVTDPKCWEREDLLSAYLDGELVSGELDEVVRHLEWCHDCLMVFHAVKEARAVVRTLPLLDPPPPVAAIQHAGDGLSAYLDGDLDSGEAATVTAHVGECGECRNELHELDAARTAIRALPRLELPTELITASSDVRPKSIRRNVAITAAAALAAATLGLALFRPEPVAPLDLNNLATRHDARVSVESGFSVIPASVSTGDAP